MYRFVVPDAGTYWYHTHQDSVRSVARGLLGALVVLPATAPPAESPSPVDVTALVHTYGTVTTINGAAGSTAVLLPDGATARVRMINSDNGPRLVTASVPYRVLAVDGADIDGGSELSDTFVELPAGGRADLLVPVDRHRHARRDPGWAVCRSRARRSRNRRHSRRGSDSTRSATGPRARLSGRAPRSDR